MFKQYILVLMAFLFITSNASAAIVFNPSFFYYTREEGDTEFNQQIINVKLGYLDESGLYIGAAYDMESRETGDGATDEDRDSLGGTIGYMSNGWSILGTYYFQSELEDYEGTGWAVDAGYIFNLGSIGLGPLISYRSWEYDEQDGSSVNPPLEHKHLLPSIQFQLTF